MILFFDTETTGLPIWGTPLDNPAQPHIVQLAMLLADEDGTERASASVIVNPQVPIPERAAAIHGITDEIADRAGIFTPTAVALFDRLAERADLIVAHNINFDIYLIRVAWERALIANGNKGRAWDVAHGGRQRYCTMEAARSVVNIPPTEKMLRSGFTKAKPPKLEECIRHFFGEEMAGAHDALVDVRACARVFFHLRALAALPQPAEAGAP